MDSIVTLDGIDIFRKDLTKEFSDLFRLSFNGSSVFLVLDDLLILDLDEFFHVN